MSMLVPAALAAIVALAAPDLDTVMLRDGGRLRGTVTEETRLGGVTIQLPDGRVEKLAPEQVSRVLYSDGAIGILGTEAPAAAPAPAGPATPGVAPPAAAAPAPADAAPGAQPGAAPQAEPPAPATLAPPPRPPPPPPPSYRPEGRPSSRFRPPSLFMLAGGIGLAVPFGDAEPSVPMSDLLQPQFLLELEAAVRLTPAFMLGVVLDVGLGGATSQARSSCRASWGNSDCTGISAHIAFQGRYSFTPYAPGTPWVALGIGSEAAGLGGSGDSSQLMYSGVQFPRLSVGYDWRTDHAAGWGLFGTLAFGRFGKVSDGGVDSDLPSTSGHGWFMMGVRAILGP